MGFLVPYVTLGQIIGDVVLLNVMQVNHNLVNLIISFILPMIAQELAALQGAGGWRQRRGHGQPAAAQGQAGQRPAAESTPREAASGTYRRSSAEGLQGAADVLEQQHQMEGIRG
jgi:hypothetical protein